MEVMITNEKLQQFEARFDADRANRIAMNAVTANGVLKTAQNYQAERGNAHEFSLLLDQGEITNQQKSGRCWMFAALNVLRYHVIHEMNLEEFQLSQSYTLFYDKLEKANYFLESILETLDEETDSRLISHLLSAPLNDGGQWDMICNLIEKYGLVPQSAMPETISSSATGEMVQLLTEKLREYACILRREHREGSTEEELRKEKETMMEEVYDILCICLGKPPKTFDFEIRDKDKNFHRDTNLTPKAFYDKYIHLDLSEYISLINAPTSDKPFHRSYSVKFLGNVKEGREVRYVNVETEVLKKAAIAQMQDGSPVWFGCDVGKELSREDGRMDLANYGKEELFHTKFTMTKGERVEYGQSLMTHAMVFMGVNLDKEGRPNRWRVENSWGKDSGKDGYYMMTDEWFDEYMYQIVVNKKYLPEEIIREYESEPILLEPWDPMGSLA